MQLGMIGLGKMGGNMKLRLEKAGHQVVGYDRNPDVADVGSLGELVAALQGPRAVWVMVPAGEPTRSTVAELGELLSEGDIVIDGGNSRFTDDAVNAALLAERGIGYVDAGVSGGVWGITEGYALMVGGAEGDVQRLMPIFNALKPEGEFGFVHAGGVGAGHYAKMVHNGIEYAMMQAYAEGYELLEASEFVDNVPEIFKSWRSGTVIRSWLLDLMDRALTDDPELARVKGYVEDSGEGRWTVDEGIRLRVPLPAITESLFARFTSRQEDSPAMKAVAALRNQFGGHAVKSE
jgi:6-phosphogluconate dehydrogenase